MIKNQDEKYMQMCINLARLGEGKVSPNPMVGCVVTNSDNKIIAKGYHHRYGENHAERDALSKLHNNEAAGGTLYVNLEPCSHYGKTPPCVDLIIEHKLKRVVIAMKDVNPKVDGITKLRKAGIDVCVGVLEDKARFLNRIFIKNMTKNMPYVVLKTATTMDGKIATRNGDSKWITSDKSREKVRQLRKKFDCIMTSSNTILSDNPSMVHKYKCILDKDLRVSANYQIYKQGKIYVASKENTPLKGQDLDLSFILNELYKRGICSVFLECGGTLAGSMLRENLIDEVYQFIAPKYLNDNSGKSCFNGDSIDYISDAKDLVVYNIQKVGKDFLIKSVVSKNL